MFAYEPTKGHRLPEVSGALGTNVRRTKSLFSVDSGTLIYVL